MDEKTLSKIEYDKVIQMLGECCGSTLGKEIALALRPVYRIADVDLGLQETTEAKEILRFNPNFSLGGIRDIRGKVQKAGLGGILEPEDFLEIADTCAASRKVKIFFSNLKGSYAHVQELGKSLGIFKTLETAIGEAILDDASIADAASDNLFQIRRKTRISQDKIRAKLDSYIRNPHTVKYLQDALVTIRGDRYVIPVKQEYRAQVPGLVHDQSSSGATLFIEPMAVVDLNNELKKLKLLEHQEIIEILKKLSQSVAAFEEELTYSLKVLGRLDFIFAKGKLSQMMDAGLPVINQEGIIKLVRARHPLIKGKVVPIDVDLGTQVQGMVITGPNTGGKTVCLKTIGLFHAMALAGMHVPADEGTKLSIFENIFADIGDEQSIEQSLSTFSSHLTNITRILQETKKNTLVLLDELGAGTDPTEGAALAMAILDYLRANQVKVIATTHYSELKTYAYNNQQIVNASVEFDVETLKPTYKLLMGIPGKSNAFEIARGLGLPEEIISRASGFLTQDQMQVANLISGLELDQRMAEKERKEAEELRKELKTIKDRLSEKEIELHNKETEILRRAQEESAQTVKKIKTEMEKIFQELKVSLDAESLRAQERALAKAREKSKNLEQEASIKTQEKRYGGKAPEKVMPGQFVQIPKLNQTGYVLSKPNQNGEVNVQAGIMKVMVKIDDLRIIDGDEKKKSDTKIGGIRMEKSRSVSPEIDLRGTSVDEALVQMDKYLDDAFIAGLSEIRVIHGKGTGALRDAVTALLRRHRHVKEFRLGGYYEGGIGVTIATLKI